MKKYWRQFMGSAIGSRDKTILKTKIELVVTFLSAIVLILLIPHLFRSYAITYTIIGFLIVLASWLIVRRLLQPIKDIQESQKRFMADAAHELFTPLSIMKANTEVALMDGENLSTQTATETLRGTLEEVDRMSHMIRNLMRVSSKTQIPFTKVNLATVTNKVVQMLESFASEHGVEIEVSSDDSAVMWGNEIALEEMVTNLLRNAIQYTPMSGLIKVIVTDNTPKDIELRVQDSGIGISDKDLKRIFVPFYRGQSSIISSHKGAGLGLSIVQETVRLHNGSIKVRSIVGRGTVVDINFSLSSELN